MQEKKKLDIYIEKNPDEKLKPFIKKNIVNYLEKSLKPLPSTLKIMENSVILSSKRGAMKRGD